MEFNEVLQKRYSCRAFAAKSVEQEKIDRILEAGRIAPTAVNKQPVHIWAVSDPALLKAILAGADDYELVAMINAGYPAAESRPSPMHGVRKASEEFVTVID